MPPRRGLHPHPLRGSFHTDSLRATGVLAETYSRAGGRLANAALLSSGRLSLVAIHLSAGTTVTNISFVSGTTPLSGGTNQWFALYSSALVKLAITSDDTSTAWSASTGKTLGLTAAYVVPASGLYYLGICVVGTVPSLSCVGTSAAGSVVLNLPPILSGTSDSSLTNPASAPDPATALTVSADLPYAYVT